MGKYPPQQHIAPFRDWVAAPKTTLNLSLRNHEEEPQERVRTNYSSVSIFMPRMLVLSALTMGDNSYKNGGNVILGFGFKPQTLCLNL